MLRPLSPRPPRRHRRSLLALAPLAVAAALCVFATGAQAQSLPRVKPAPKAEPPPTAASDAAPPQITLTADDIVSHTGGVAQASGKVELQRLDTRLTSDLLTYDQLADTAHAQGNVRITRGQDWFTASRMDLEMTRDAGTLLDTEYELGARKAGGHAKRIELIDRERSSAFVADYTSCPRDIPRQEPDWYISGDRIDIDTATNEGKATHAVLHFLGVPILAAPSLTFPVTAERKSGWLPPTADFSTNSGLTLGVPYYWNIQPNIDATFTPTIITKRGAALTTELRYVEPSDLGQLTGTLLPDDRAHGDDTRGSLEWAHEGNRSDWLKYSARVQRVSDDQYWKDFPNQVPSLTQRLLPTDLSGTRRFLPFGDAGEIDTYARVQRYQTLQEPDDTTPLLARADSGSILAPYQRSPQVGLRGNVTLANQLHFDFETEGNRFDLSDRYPGDDRVGGTRFHAIGAVSREFRSDWGRFEPRLSINGASYHTDTQPDGTRIDETRWVPTFSADSTFSFERQARLFGRDLVQTLEPHVLYVLTPYRRQENLPLYDTAAKDINEVSIYSTNQFTGIDRIPDENQLTVGTTTRFNDAVNGRELLSLGIAQRLLFRDQRITTDGSPDKNRFSDLLLYGSSSAMEHWSFDGLVDVNPSAGWTQAANVSARLHPGPFKSLSLTYRYTRGASEQYEVSGQWPVYHRGPASTGHGCGGTLYAVARADYSVSDSRLTNAIGGFEYDAGCWIGRLIVQRTSTGQNESTTHVVLQLELNGLSTLGTGSLRILKDNVPGYQPLRNDTGTVAAPSDNP